MDFYEFYEHMKLLGYEVIGLSYRGIDQEKRLKENRKRYNEFVKELDLSPVKEYFKIGLKAQVFRDNVTNRVLKEKDDLMWLINDGGYQYSFRRQPLQKKQQQFTPEMLKEIYQQAKQEKLKNEKL